MIPPGRYADPTRYRPGSPPGADAFLELLGTGQLLPEVAFHVHLCGGAVVRGRATPDEVRWTCPCGACLDLLSEAAQPVTGGLRVECPCGRGYWCGPGPWLVAVNGVWQDGAWSATGGGCPSQQAGLK